MRPDGDPATDLGIVVIPDIFGLRPLFEDMATDLAARHSWPVAVIDPFPGQDLGPDVDARFDAMSSLEDDRLLGDAALAATALGTPRVACIGFCMGGMYALKAAATGAFVRTVAFYGMIRLPLIWRGPGQAEPFDCLRRRSPHTEVLAVIGGRDPYTPAADVALLTELAGVTVVEYPDAEHGFVHDASRPAHRPADAADAWSRAVAFLES